MIGEKWRGNLATFHYVNINKINLCGAMGWFSTFFLAFKVFIVLNFFLAS